MVVFFFTKGTENKMLNCIVLLKIIVKNSGNWPILTDYSIYYKVKWTQKEQRVVIITNCFKSKQWELSTHITQSFAVKTAKVPTKSHISCVPCFRNLITQFAIVFEAFILPFYWTRKKIRRKFAICSKAMHCKNAIFSSDILYMVTQMHSFF